MRSPGFDCSNMFGFNIIQANIPKVFPAIVFDDSEYLFLHFMNLAIQLNIPILYLNILQYWGRSRDYVQKCVEWPIKIMLIQIKAIISEFLTYFRKAVQMCVLALKSENKLEKDQRPREQAFHCFINNIFSI